jgi:hypothetical protein
MSTSITHVEPALTDTGAFAYTFTADGVAIENPFESTCGRFEVDPSFYGFETLTDNAAMWMRKFTLDGKPVLLQAWKEGDIAHGRVVSLGELQEPVAEWTLFYDEIESGYLQLPTDPAKRLAVLFGVEIRQYLTPSELAEANKRNAAETDTLICHTHDFCDANMAMDAAFERVYAKSVSDYPDGSDEQQAAFKVWNAAWGLAATNKFWAV